MQEVYVLSTMAANWLKNAEGLSFFRTFKEILTGKRSNLAQ